MKYALTLAALFLSTCLLAGVENPLVQTLPGAGFIGGPANPFLPPNLIDNGTPTAFNFNDPTWSKGFILKSVTNLVRLSSDPNSAALIDFDYTLQVPVLIKYYLNGNPIPVILPVETLTINYHPDPNQQREYRQTDAFRFTGGCRVEVQVQSGGIVATALSGATLLPQQLLQLAQSVFLESEIQVERYYNFDVTNSSTMLCPADFSNSAILANSNELQIAWTKISAAEEYDLEWIFIDDYDGNGGYLPPSALRYDFNKNAARVQIRDNFYRVPLVYEHGYLLYRVRGIGRNPADNFVSPMPGLWSCGNNNCPSITCASTSGSLAFFANKYPVGQAHEGDTKNWQAVKTYAEEGKHKTVVAYFDGTMRNRESVTGISTDQTTIVGQTIYDYQGRPAITVLPAPVNNATLKYYANFNQNLAGQPYNRADFDEEKLPCQIGAGPMLPNNSGAAHYYSPFNPDKSTGFNAYLPDAEGYPFTQTQYTPDNTGRIARQSGVGPTHKIGAGRETRYYYAVPSQEELDQLFGNEAGFAMHYKKNGVVDANGQLSLSYLDAKGNTVATALAGRPPFQVDNKGDTITTLEPLPSYKPVPMSVDLMAHNRVDADHFSIVMEKTELVSTASDYIFNYSYLPENFKGQNCEGVDFCLDCIYELHFKIVDNLNCGKVIYDTLFTIGQLFTPTKPPKLSLDCEFSYTWTPLPPDTVRLDVGSYTFTKVLSVSEAAADAYVAAVLDTCPKLFNAILQQQYAQMDTSGCAIDCADAVADQSNTTYYNSLTPDEKKDLDELVKAVCDSLSGSSCEAAYAGMLADVSPGGQYGAVPDVLGNIASADAAVSVYMPLNVLGVNALSIAYPDPNGSGTLPLFTTLDDLLDNWRPEWAEQLLPFHPEYCYYQLCIQHIEKSDLYNAKMMNTLTWQDAVNAGYIVAGNAVAIMQNDPFFSPVNPALNSLVPGYVTSMNNNIVQFKSSGKSIMYLALEAANYPNPLPGTVVWSSFSPAIRDRAWAIYRGLYLSYKEELYYAIRTRNAFNGNCYNECIGADPFYPALNGFWNGAFQTPSSEFYDINEKPCNAALFPLFAKKAKRFPSIYDILPKGFPYDFFNSNPQDVFDFLYGQAEQQVRENCCDSLEEELPDFLFALFLADQPTFTLDLTANNAFPDQLEAMLLNGAAQLTTGTYSYNKTSGFCLINFGNGSHPCDRLQFKLPPNFNGVITGFCCISMISNPVVFTGPGIHFQMVVNVAGGNNLVVEGFIKETCHLFCPPKPMPCTDNTALALEFTNLFNYLLYQQKFRAGAVTIPASVVGPQMAALYTQTSGNFTWNAPTGGGNPFTATLQRGPELYALNFTEPASFTWGTLMMHELQIDKTKLDAQGKTKYFILRLRKPDGSIVDVKGFSEPWVLSDCLLSTEPATANQPCKPFRDPPRDSTIMAMLNFVDNCGFPCDTFAQFSLPVDNPCVEQMIAIAKHNAEEIYRDSMQQLRAGMKAAYLKKCLATAEKYTAKYLDARHHFTLYYYDQANNLVETVPPEGVRLLTAAQTAQAAKYRQGMPVQPVYGAHKLVSRYRYNSLNQLTWQYIPDHKLEDLFFYDGLGRLAASVNAVQRLKFSFSYTRYDALGRIIEVGQNKRSTAGGLKFFLLTLSAKALDYKNWDAYLNQGAKTEMTLTDYDRTTPAWAAQFPDGRQENLRGRVAAIAWTPKPNAAPNELSQMWYSYDIHGNVKTLVQHAFDLDAKTVVYHYDLVSGKVNSLDYQPGQPDQFHHRYTYDADNRLTEVHTSPDSVLWDTDARYRYYKHGPLARVEIGNDHVQGLDYAYSLQGWIKGMNSGSLQARHDMGKDGQNAGPGNFARDAVGFTLGYFNGDYKPIGPNVSFEPAYTGSNLDDLKFAPTLFNGNIRHMVTAIEPFMAASGPNKPLATLYHYDQLNRLLRDTVDLENFDPTPTTGNKWLPGSLDQRWSNSFTYDANGNILSQHRNGDKAGPQTAMDALRYQYYPNNNQLQKVTDPVPDGNYTEDIDNQTATNNYLYDAIGNLTTDVAEKLSIQWNLQGKVSRIIDTDAPQKTITFGYTPQGNRAAKTVNGESTYHIYDASGNVLATYRRNASHVTLESAWLFGSSRLGEYRAEKCLVGCPKPFELPGHYYSTRGKRRYEETNHLGNVLAVVSDRKMPEGAGSTVSGFSADLVGAQDYYPFGMLMPGRTISGDGRFGFNGKEDIDEIDGMRNYHDYGSRLYLALLCRFLSVDSLFKRFPWYSPYQFSGNNPILNVDLDGLEDLNNNDLNKNKINGDNIIEPKNKPDVIWLDDQDPFFEEKKSFYLNKALEGIKLIINTNSDPGLSPKEKQQILKDFKLEPLPLIKHKMEKMEVEDDNSGFEKFMENWMKEYNNNKEIQENTIIQEPPLAMRDSFLLRKLIVRPSNPSVDYRFGFNGQEKDDEVAGSGNNNTAKYWEYDTRLGRRWNIDPVVKVSQSSYACLGNNPIIKIDVNGNDDYYNYAGKYVGNDGQKTNNIRLVSSKQAFDAYQKQGVETLQGKSRVVVIQENIDQSINSIYTNSVNNRIEQKAYIVLDTKNATLTIEVQPQSPEDKINESKNEFESKSRGGDKYISPKGDNGDKVIVGQIHGHPGKELGKNVIPGPSTGEKGDKQVAIDLGVPVYPVDKETIYKVDQEGNLSNGVCKDECFPILIDALETSGNKPK